MADFNNNMSMTDNVLVQLRKEINDSALMPGQFITEQEVSSKYKVSKTPAREALGILCQEGILNKIPRRGYIVKAYSIQEMVDLIRFRQTVEMGIIRLAVRFATDAELDQLVEIANCDMDTNDPEFPKAYSKYNLEFHLFTAKLSRNKYLYDALENTMIKLKTVLVHTGKEHIENDIKVHLMLAQAMRRREADEACRIEYDDLEKSIPILY